MDPDPAVDPLIHLINFSCDRYFKKHSRGGELAQRDKDNKLRKAIMKRIGADEVIEKSLFTGQKGMSLVVGVYLR